MPTVLTGATPSVVSVACGAVIVATILAGVFIQGRFPINDSAMFEYFGRALARGSVLYRDIWDNKLPGIYYVNALGYGLFRDNYQAHAAAEVAVAFASALLLRMVLHSFNVGKTLIAATALFAMLCFLFTLNTTEAYALPLILLSVLAAHRQLPILCGVAIGLATIFWIPSILMVAVIATVLTPARLPALVLATAGVAAVTAGAIALTSGTTTLLTLAHAWTAYVSTSPPAGTHPKLAFLRNPVVEDAITAIWRAASDSGAAALCVVLFAVVHRPRTSAQRFGLVWTVVMLLGAMAAGHFYSHYCIPLLAALLFTVAAYWSADAIALPRAALFALAFVLASKTVLDARASWLDVFERSALVARIADVAGPIVAHRLTLETDTYTPDLYLALDPVLRSPYEISAPANERLSTALPAIKTQPDVMVYRITKPTGPTVCDVTAAPWTIVVKPSFIKEFSDCR